jgi:hypothetical protein
MDAMETGERRNAAMADIARSLENDRARAAASLLQSR